MPKKNSENSVVRALDSKTMVALISETVSLGSSFVLSVTGNSMYPILRHNKDKVELVSTQIRPVKKGEIVLFRRDSGMCILHRIVKIIDEHTCVAKGDAQGWDEIVKRDNVIAVVSRIYVNNRWISCDSFWYKNKCRLWSVVKPLYISYGKIRNNMQKIKHLK